MLPEFSPPVAPKDAGALSTFLPSADHPALVQIGAQFCAENEPSKILRVAKASDSVANVSDSKEVSCPPKMLEKYLQDASRTEILRLGMQQPCSSRLFDSHLICTIDKLLQQIEGTVIGETVLPSA